LERGEGRREWGIKLDIQFLILELGVLEGVERTAVFRCKWKT